MTLKLFSELVGYLANKVKARYPTLLFNTVQAFIRSFPYIQNSAVKREACTTSSDSFLHISQIYFQFSATEINLNKVKWGKVKMR